MLLEKELCKVKLDFLPINQKNFFCYLNNIIILILFYIRLLKYVFLAVVTPECHMLFS